MPVTYTFANATSAIPLSQLDNNFATPITIGNVAIQLGNTVSSIGNVTLANATVSNSTLGNVTITSVASTFPNNYLSNSSVTIGNTAVALGSSASTIGNVTLTNATLSSLATPITTAEGGTGLSGSTPFTANGVVYASSTSALATGSTLVFDGSNLGLGTTPSAWSSSYKAFDIGLAGTVYADTAYPTVIVSANNYYNGTNTVYKQTGYGATKFTQFNGVHTWYNAPSGTAGGTVSFTQAMTLDTSGSLLVGDTSNHSNQLVVNASASVNPLYLNVPTGYNCGVQFAENQSIKWQLQSLASGAGFRFYDNVAGAERMRIDSSGNLLVGTTTAKTTLTVNGGGVTGLNGSSFAWQHYQQASSSYTATSIQSVLSGASSYLTFSTNSNWTNANAAEAMRIDSSGNLLVGTTSTGIPNANSNAFLLGNTVNAHASTPSGASYQIFGYNGNNIGSITQSGTTGVLYNTSSDQRLKTNIVDAPAGNIDQIKIRSFDWKDDGSHQTYGMIAQELLEVAPYAVHVPANPDEMMGVDYSKLVPMMIKEIQSLKAEVATLKGA